jgi:hypoxanthine phosphoribosyltransferase
MTVPNNLKVISASSEVKSSIFTMAENIRRITPYSENMVFIIILKGGIYVGMKLLDLFPGVPFGLLGLSSYGDNTVGGKTITYTKTLDLSPDFLQGKNVWIVDDVADSGKTFTMAVNLVIRNKPKSIHTAALVRKKAFGNFEPDVIGVQYSEKEFLVGCGMGLGERYRTLPYVAELKDFH